MLSRRACSVSVDDDATELGHRARVASEQKKLVPELAGTSTEAG
jgi:hypothetical protein